MMLDRIGLGFFRVTICLLLCAFQYVLWLGDSGVLKLKGLWSRVQSEKMDVKYIREKNMKLRRSIDAIKSGSEQAQSLSRERMYMISEGEKLYIFE